MDSASSLVQARPRTAVAYIGFVIGCVYCYRTLETKPTGEYDYLLTLSAAMQVLAFALLVLDTRSQVAEGLSEKTLWAFLTAHISRLSTTFWGKGYVPEDSTSDVYLYQLCELIGVCLLGWKVLHLSTMRTMHDVGQGLERWSMLAGMCGAAMLLAYFTKSTGHDDWFADLSWMFSVWLESFALFPQVMLLDKASQVDETAVHFAALTLGSSLIFAGFWGRTAADRYEEFQRLGAQGFLRGIVTAAMIRIILCVSYFYLFMRSRRTKGRGGSEYELCSPDEL